VWLLAFWGVCLLSAASGHLADPRHTIPTAEIPAAVGVLTGGPDAAVIPARVVDDVRAISHGAPLRLLLLSAVLAVLVGLPAVLRRRMTSAAGGHEPLRSRRHTIALRAPPLQFA
jgi:hypothetical protein